MSEVVAFQDAELPGGIGFDSGITGLTFALHRGQSLLCVTEAGRRLPLADAAEGLLPPAAGTVSFLESRWDEMSAEQAAANRGRIGRVFGGPAWISNLDVDENVTLRARHHGILSPARASEEADTLARRFGLADGVPRSRPAWVDAGSLQRSQWVRALLGDPALILLEFPEEGTEERWVAALREELGKALSNGSALCWITARPELCMRNGIEPDLLCRIESGAWVLMSK